MDKLTLGISILYSLATLGHLIWPNNAFFQRFGAAVRQLGPKP